MSLSLDETRTTKSEDAGSTAQPQHQNLTEGNPTAMYGFKLWAIFIGICFGAFLMSLDIFVIATAIPSITSDFKDTSQLAWYPAAYSLTTCALTPLAGKLSATFPLRWIYITFFSIFMVGSLICGFAPNSNSFIVGRAVAGIGASGVASGGFIIVLTVTSDKAKPLLMGGAFTQKATWRWCFWVNLPPGAMTLVAMLLFFKLPSIQRDQTALQRIKNLDLIGCVIFIPAIFMLLLAMMWGGTEKPWGSVTIIGLFIGSGVMLILFVGWEHYKGDGAMIPGNLIVRRTITFSVLFSFCHFGSLGILNYYLPEWFQAVEGASPLESGTRVLASVLAQIVGTISSGILARKVNFYNPWLFAGPLFMCTAAALYTQFTAFDTPSSHWIGFQVIQGLGVGMAQQMPSLIVQLAVHDKPELMPAAVSLNLFFQYLGATVTQVIGGIVFRSILGKSLDDHGLNATQIALLSAAGTAGIRDITNANFPTLLHPVLESYNKAITSAFFVAVGTTAAAFCFAFGVKWTRIHAAKSTDPEADEVEQK
ncbi:Major facilitator superfamily domain, general substrate transporter [Penicillium expansum]|uniref:Major facilitator superfamily domain, general substrate transporter n=1 Tax=Penicillium expansum TaxID=27334 RepID=A0A0A2K2B6_PENEN|nr:Major facilitator superfamily domain, general substrate transporter [Penicillium expansum]KGO43061.1 Major facilitator superfamily domain, general substrate transporter [Penicillium expansum]KGO44314.1 Major facilitator superfamily domain, general substrate transporter [Penicillium expansum]KGO58570.1 Major facilitator superfamily domain, general substrate transporter [Penicillium expansum]